MTKRRTRKAAVTAAGTRGQRGSHGDGSPAGATTYVHDLRALISGLMDFPFGLGDTDRVNDPSLPVGQQIIDAEFKS
jgi:hypothetical protein